MKRTIFILMLLASASAFAGDYEDGEAAYNRRDYTTAYSKFMEAAEQGYVDAQVDLV